MKTLQDRQFSFPFNWLLCQSQLHDFVGKYRFYCFMQKHFSGRVIRYTFNQQPFFVPLEQWCFWLEKGPKNYYPQDIEPFIAAINEINDSVLLIDCGADIGTVSMLVGNGCKNIAQFVCLEPNPNAFEILQANQFAIGKQTKVLKQAVSNFNGQAELCFDSALTSDHEGHISPKINGKTEVTTLDALFTGQGLANIKNLALKIDVEGQEKAVFEGAKELIQGADCCLVLLELHPDVLRRENQTAEDIFTAAEDIADFNWTVPEVNNQVVDRSVEFFKQFPQKQYDVLGIKK